MKIVLAGLLLIGVCGYAAAQSVQIKSLPASPAANAPQGIKPPVAKSEAQNKLEAALDAAAKTLAESKAFSLKQESSWSFVLGDQTKEGKNVFETLVLKPNQFLIKAYSAEKPENAFTVISDGKSVVRLLPAGKIYSIDETVKVFEELPDDAMTNQVLEGSYIPHLIRPNLRGAFFDMIDRIEEYTPEKSEANIEHFKVHLDNKKELTISIQTGAQARIIKLITSNTLPLDKKKSAVMTITTSLDWNFQAQAEPEQFSVKIPQGLKKVDDLLQFLSFGDAAELLGQKLPSLVFKDLEGKEVKISDHKDQIIMLYFYASWAAPSAEDMPNVNRFIDTYTKKGAAMYAINVAESVADIKKLNEKNGYKGTILRDEKGAALAQLNLTSLPVSILVGKDGTLQGIYKGSKLEVKQQLRKDLEVLLSGKTLIEKK
jgi:peroxiredoxin